MVRMDGFSHVELCISKMEDFIFNIEVVQLGLQ